MNGYVNEYLYIATENNSAILSLPPVPIGTTLKGNMLFYEQTFFFYNRPLLERLFLTYETEFVLFIAVLEIPFCPWAETAHT